MLITTDPATMETEASTEMKTRKRSFSSCQETSKGMDERLCSENDPAIDSLADKHESAFILQHEGDESLQDDVRKEILSLM